jgi:hypothetical protein
MARPGQLRSRHRTAEEMAAGVDHEAEPAALQVGLGRKIIPDVGAGGGWLAGPSDQQFFASGLLVGARWAVLAPGAGGL